MNFTASLKPSPSLVYPIIEVRSLDPKTGLERLIEPCCFHDLLSGDAMDLAGMGLTILGNMIQGLKRKALDRSLRYRIALQMSKGSDVIPLPWPGMPNDKPIPLNVEILPLDYTMFLDPSECKFMRRVDRVKLMKRINDVWVPHLKGLMKKHG